MLLNTNYANKDFRIVYLISWGFSTFFYTKKEAAAADSFESRRGSQSFTY